MAIVFCIRCFVLFFILFLQSVSAYAAYDIKKVGDWKYRSYVCKNAVRETLFLSDLISAARKELKNSTESVDDSQIVNGAMAETENQISQNLVKEEKEYPFDLHDAQLVVLLTTSMYIGLQEVEQNPSPSTIVRIGFSTCFSLFEIMDEKLKDSLKN